MSAILKQFDLFGVSFTQPIEKDSTQFKSVPGGLATIVIYFASLMYTIYIIVLWSLGEFSPKISTNLSVREFKVGRMDLGQVIVEFWRYNEVLLDPFKAQGNIITPLLYTAGQYGNKTESLLNDEEIELSYFNSSRVKADLGQNYELNPLSGEVVQVAEQYILFMSCDPKFMKDGHYCATEEEKQQFFNQTQNYMTLTMKFTRLNPDTQNLETWNEDIYFMLDELVCYQQQITLQQVSYEIKSNVLPTVLERQVFMERLINQGQTVSTQYCKRAYKLNVIFAVFLQLSNMKKSYIYEYPSAGDVFANIGSIVSILLMSKYIFLGINQYFLDQRLLNQLIDFYYPEFKKIVVGYNWRRQINRVTFHNKSIMIDDYNNVYAILKYKMLGKLSVTNIIYEISRLGLIIRSFESKDNIRKSHGLGIRVKLKEAKTFRTEQVQVEDQISNSLSDNEYPQIRNILEDDDCSLLSLESRTLYVQSNSIDASSPNDYYDVNQIIV